MRIDEVVMRVGLSRPTLWRLEKAELFPKRRQLGPHSVGWIAEEVEAWLQSRAVVEEAHKNEAQTAAESPN